MTAIELPTTQLFEPLPSSAIDAAAAHLRDVLAIALEHGPGRRALVVFDRRTALACALLEGYRRNLPEAEFIDFDAVTPDVVLGAFKTYAAGDWWCWCSRPISASTASACAWSCSSWA